MSDARKLLWPVAVIVLAVGCSSPPAKSSPEKPRSFTLSGTVTLVRGATDASDGVSCTGWAGMGFGKVTEGATVTVFDKDGVKVAEGTLGLGKAPEGYAVPCQFPVRVPGVPVGDGPYQVRVADQKMVTVSEAKAKTGTFAASLG